MARLSLRLQTLLDMLAPAQLLADIGTDHGLLPAEAVSVGKAAGALAVDRLTQPLAGAERELKERDLLGQVELVHADGLSELKARGVDAVTIAGMGGLAMVRICEATPEVVRGLSQLIVQPNTEAHLTRAYAKGVGLHLSDERMVHEAGRFFVICKFTPQPGDDPAYCHSDLAQSDAFKLGPLLLKRQDPIALKFYRSQLKRWESLCPSPAHSIQEQVKLYRRAVTMCTDTLRDDCPSKR